jgi:hypothetical protein
MDGTATRASAWAWVGMGGTATRASAWGWVGMGWHRHPRKRLGVGWGWVAPPRAQALGGEVGLGGTATRASAWG